MLDFKRYFRANKEGGEHEISEDPAQTLEEALRCYVALLGAVADHAPDRPKHLKEDYGHHLRKIRDEVAQGADSRLLSDSSKRAHTQLKSYGKALEGHIEQTEKNARDVMAMVASMAESIASQEKQYNVRFRGIAKKLRLLATAGDMEEIRQRLSEEAGQLDRYIEDMSRDTRSALDRVTMDLMVLAERANPMPWLEREPDGVTQLPGRPEGRAAIETRQRMGTPFCLARFAIKGYSTMAERWKVPDKNAVLGEFSARLREQMKSHAAALCRWGEAEFVAVFDCPLPQVAEQLSEAEQKLAGDYEISRKGNPVGLKCAASAVQPFRGESVEQLMVRLENSALEPAAPEESRC